MRQPSPRMLKVNSTLREVVADEVERLADSRLEMVSITGVDTAPDLRHAVVYIDVLDSHQHQPALDALRRAARRIQSAIGRQVRIKYTPTLEFRIDHGVIGGERMDTLLRSLRTEQEEE
jgi:ribosome-binding factor A